jgi:hypothetical protein
MDLSIVIVTWNNERQIHACLRSLFEGIEGIEAEVFVVDNNSNDATRYIVEREFPQAKRIWNSENRGFAAACNQAMRQSIGDTVLLLNPDTEVIVGALRTMLDYLRVHPGVGVAGGKVLNMDGSIQPSVRRFPDWFSQAMILTKLYRFFPSLTAHYFCDGFDYDRDHEVDQVRGAYFFVTRRLMEKIGLMDEKNFFIWFEEVDYCKRAKDAGFKVVYAPLSSVMHEGGVCFAQEISVRKQRYLNRSMRNYFWKHGQYGAAIVAVALHPVSLALAYFVQTVKIKPKTYV